MAKKATAPSSLPPPPPVRGDQLERLIEKVSDLTGSVADLVEEVNMLRDAVEDCRQEIESIMRTRIKPPALPPLHITSMPKDPLDPKFHEKLNRLRPEDLPAADASPATATQSELF